MATNVSIDQQIIAINRQLDKLALGLKQDIANNKRLKTKAARPLANAIKNNVIVKTGKLKKAAGFVPMSKSSDVFVGVNYRKNRTGHLLEYGFDHKSGKRVEAKPFIRPAYDAQKGVVLSNLTQLAKKELDFWGKKLETSAQNI